MQNLLPQRPQDTDTTVSSAMTLLKMTMTTTHTIVTIPDKFTAYKKTYCAGHSTKDFNPYNSPKR